MLSLIPSNLFRFSCNIYHKSIRFFPQTSLAPFCRYSIMSELDNSDSINKSQKDETSYEDAQPIDSSQTDIHHKSDQSSTLNEEISSSTSDTLIDPEQTKVPFVRLSKAEKKAAKMARRKEHWKAKVQYDFNSFFFP